MYLYHVNYLLQTYGGREDDIKLESYFMCILNRNSYNCSEKYSIKYNFFDKYFFKLKMNFWCKYYVKNVYCLLILLYYQLKSKLNYCCLIRNMNYLK